MDGKLAHFLLLFSGSVLGLGSFVTTIGDGRRKLVKYPVNDECIRLQLLFQTPFAHPAVLFNRSALGSLRYDPKISYAEDYALWVQIAKQCSMANIPESLLDYRIHQGQISSKKILQNKDAGKIRLIATEHLNLSMSPDEKETHSNLRYSIPYSTTSELIAAEEWLKRLAAHLDTTIAKEHISYEWYLCCIRATHFGWWTWQRYSSSILTTTTRPNKKHNLQLQLLCLSKTKYKSTTYRLLEKI